MRAENSIQLKLSGYFLIFLSLALVSICKGTILVGCEPMNKLSLGRKKLKEFESMRNFAELRALSKYSLEHPLSKSQTRRFLELGKKTGLRK